MTRVLLCFLFAFLSGIYGFGQAVPDTSLKTVISDSAREEKLAEPQQSRLAITNPAVVTKSAFQPIPKKSALYSAMLPGAGQFYNRQYWKVPLVYAGVATSLYFLIDNTNNYRDYRKRYLNSLDPLGVPDEIYSGRQLQILQDAYRRYLDLTILFTALGYTIQVLDALVYAHLKNFDVSKDISMHLAPVGTPQGVGLGLVVNFR